MSAPRIGQRVRFLRHDHKNIPPGRGGMIDQVHPNDASQFVVLTDCGGWCMWTSLHSWEFTGEPDVALNQEYVAMRTQGLNDNCRIKRTK